MWLAVFGFLVTFGNTVRLFLLAEDRSAWAVAAWAVWSVALAAPLIFAALERRQPPYPRQRAVALNYILLGYGLAGFALLVIGSRLGA